MYNINFKIFIVLKTNFCILKPILEIMPYTLKTIRVGDMPLNNLSSRTV